MFNHASGQLLPEHTWNPRCAQNFFVDSCSVRHQGNCCASTREIPATWMSICTQGPDRCSCDRTAVLARHKHTWISLRAQRHVPAKRLLRSHAASTLGSLSVRKQEHMFMRQTSAFASQKHTWISPCSKRQDSAKRLLRSHAASTLGSRSVRKETCSIEETAAISRCPPR